jgi:molecular chaperone Hsp33
LHGDRKEKLEKISEVLEHYMLQSEQLDTRLILAADDKIAAGLLIQRMPMQGEGNLEKSREDDIGLSDDEPPLGANAPSGGSEDTPVRSVGATSEAFNRIAIFAQSLKRQELLELDADTILHRLFWEEKLLRFEPDHPKFACTCSRERVSSMLRNLGVEEVESILTEREQVEVGCDFCGAQYRFDAIDAAEIFTQPLDHLPGPDRIQ